MTNWTPNDPDGTKAQFYPGMLNADPTATQLTPAEIYAGALRWFPNPDDALAATMVVLDVSDGWTNKGANAGWGAFATWGSGPIGLFQIDKPTAEGVGSAYAGANGQQVPDKSFEAARRVFDHGLASRSIGPKWDLWKPHPWTSRKADALKGQAIYTADPDKANAAYNAANQRAGNLSTKAADAATNAIPGASAVTTLLGNLTNPSFLLRVAMGAGGAVMVLMGAWLVVEHTGGGAAISNVIGKVPV